MYYTHLGLSGLRGCSYDHCGNMDTHLVQRIYHPDKRRNNPQEVV